MWAEAGTRAAIVTACNLFTQHLHVRGVEVQPGVVGGVTCAELDGRWFGECKHIGHIGCVVRVVVVDSLRRIDSASGTGCTTGDHVTIAVDAPQKRQRWWG